MKSGAKPASANIRSLIELSKSSQRPNIFVRAALHDMSLAMKEHLTDTSRSSAVTVEFNLEGPAVHVERLVTADGEHFVIEDLFAVDRYVSELVKQV